MNTFSYLEAILSFIFGFLLLYRPTMEWIIKFKNMIQGIQTNITDGTVIASRVFGIFFVLYAFLLLFAPAGM